LLREKSGVYGLIFYLFNACFILVLGLIFSIINVKNKNKVLAIIIFLQLFLISALRSLDVGADMPNYISYFTSIASVDFPSFNLNGLEQGYVFLNSLISLVSKNVHFFVGVVAFLVLLGYFLFIYKNTMNIVLSSFLFITFDFFSLTLSTYRQSFAIVLLLMSYEYIKKRKLFPFLVLVILASLFHKTALIFIPFYFITKIKITNKYILATFAGASFCVLASKKLVEYLVMKYYPLYSEYIISGEGFKMLVMLILIFAFSYPFRKVLVEKDPNNDLIYHALIVAIILQLLALQFSLFTRVTFYFTVFIIILIPKVLKSIKSKDIRVIVYILIFIISILQLSLSLQKDLLSIVPYSFLWDRG